MAKESINVLVTKVTLILFDNALNKITKLIIYCMYRKGRKTVLKWHGKEEKYSYE